MTTPSRRFVFRPLPGLTVAFVLSLIFLVGLGNWQLERREWKLQIIEDMQNRLSTPPKALPTKSEWSSSLAQMEWQPISVEGVFLPRKEVHYLSGYNHAGYLVLAPLLVTQAHGEKVIVFVARGDVDDPYLVDPGFRTFKQRLGDILRSHCSAAANEPDQEQVAHRH